MLFLEEKKKNTVRVGLSGVAELTADYCWTPSRAVGYSELAVLLNNGPCRKIPESRCSNTHLCIHEELIGPWPTLFIQPLQVLVFYTPCRKSSACSSSHLACHSNFTVFSLILSISDFSQLSSVRAFLWFFFGGWNLLSLRIVQNIWFYQSLQSKLKVTARVLIMFQSKNAEQRRRSTSSDQIVLWR